MQKRQVLFNFRPAWCSGLQSGRKGSWKAGGMGGFLKFVGGDFGTFRVRVRQARGNFRLRRKPPNF